jgi:hypothetical protein
VIFYLFKFLHHQLGASSKKAGVGFSRDGSVFNTIPRTIVRRILMEYLTTFQLRKPALQSDVDIILQPLPIQLNLQQFSFVLLVASCRRVGLKAIPDQSKLTIVFSKYSLSTPTHPSVSTPSTGSLRCSMNIAITKISLVSRIFFHIIHLPLLPLPPRAISQSTTSK